MVPPTRSPQRRKKARKNVTVHIRSSQAAESTFPKPKDSLRKTAQRATDPAGDIREGDLAVSVAPPEADLSAHYNPLVEKTVTVKEAAYRLGKSTDAVYQWLRTGRLRGRQPGGRCCAILVVESSVNEALLCSFQRAGAGRGRPRLFSV